MFQSTAILLLRELTDDGILIKKGKPKVCDTTRVDTGVAKITSLKYGCGIIISADLTECRRSQKTE